MIEKIGAPEEIRTPDPQIRRPGSIVEISSISNKPGKNRLLSNQGVTRTLTNRRSHPPDDPENGTAGALAGATGGKQNSGTALVSRTVSACKIDGRCGAPIFDDRWQAERAIFAAGELAYPGAPHG